MNLTDATRMIVAESVALPDLMRVARYAHDELAAGRRVSHATLRWMLREAGLMGVFDTIKQRHGTDVVKDMVLLLDREINRHVLTAGASA